ncbi:MULTISPECIES: benenodin family lasso peptide [unclassified Sphingomonas]|nr:MULTISPECIES: benenodin family lasso peptide [unclassified Sphingomonas]
MDREPNETVDLIDLGVASAETQGGDKGQFDLAGLVIPPGISDD